MCLSILLHEVEAQYADGTIMTTHAMNDDTFALIEGLLEELVALVEYFIFLVEDELCDGVMMMILGCRCRTTRR